MKCKKEEHLKNELISTWEELQEFFYEENLDNTEFITEDYNELDCGEHWASEEYEGEDIVK